MFHASHSFYDSVLLPYVNLSKFKRNIYSRGSFKSLDDEKQAYRAPFLKPVTVFSHRTKGSHSSKRHHRGRGQNRHRSSSVSPGRHKHTSKKKKSKSHGTGRQRSSSWSSGRSSSRAHSRDRGSSKNKSPHVRQNNSRYTHSGLMLCRTIYIFLK